MAWNSIPREMLKKGFESTGLYLYNPNIPINNELTNKHFELQNNQRHFVVQKSSQDLTSNVVILAIHNEKFGTKYTDINQVPQIKYESICERFPNFDIHRGLVLSKFPKILREVSNLVKEIVRPNKFFSKEIFIFSFISYNKKLYICFMHFYFLIFYVDA